MAAPTEFKMIRAYKVLGCFHRCVVSSVRTRTSSASSSSILSKDVGRWAANAPFFNSGSISCKLCAFAYCSTESKSSDFSIPASGFLILLSVRAKALQSHVCTTYSAALFSFNTSTLALRASVMLRRLSGFSECSTYASFVDIFGLDAGVRLGQLWWASE